MTEPSRAYARALVQILDEHGQCHGSGVAVGDRRILTCAHVVALAAGLGVDADEVPDATELRVRRPYLSSGHSPPQAAVVLRFVGRHARAPEADLALLEIRDKAFLAAPNRPFQLPRFDLEPPRRDDLVFVRGFPSDKGRSAFAIDEATYEVGAEAENDWRLLTARRAVGSEIRPGFSGAPVWSERRRAVVGIITEADVERRTAAMIPASALELIEPLPVYDEEEGPLEPGEGEVQARKVGAPGLRRLLLDTIAPRLHFWLTVRAGSLRDPPERAVIHRHMEVVAARFEEELADKTYLPPPSTVGDPPVREFRPLRQVVRAITGLSAGGDAANAYLSSIRRSRRVHRLIDFLLRSRVPLILLADPGAGKSLTLQQAAIGIARRNKRRVFPDLFVFVRLGRWRPEDAEPDAAAVEALVAASCPAEVRAYLGGLESRNRLIVIFDGMDEMSRYRYVEHTEALSVYARARQGGVRTLFSCRLADFSPSFRHRRLVLSPFDARLVRTYLARQLGARAVEVDGETVGIRALARRLLEPDIPIQANNPYVLYLLSLFIRDKHSIPTKRVELLEYFFRSSCERKAKEVAEAIGRAAPSGELFPLWGLIAFEITQRNQGSEIPATEIERLTAEAETAIAAGRAAGVLIESLPESPDSPATIRFDSHRAQEYFTAWYIAHRLPAFDWSGRLDAPRWQETLVNVAQMGAAAPAIGALAATMSDAPAAIAKVPAGPERVLAEADAAERVDLAARVALDLPVEAPERAELQASIRAAAGWFLAQGNAVSKVTMLRAIQRSPDFGSLPMIEGALEDKSQWVRERAQVVAAGLLRSGAGEMTTRELVYSYARGDLVQRLRSIFRLAFSLKSPRLAVLAGVGALLLGLQGMMFASLGPAAALGVQVAAAGAKAEPPAPPAADPAKPEEWESPAVTVARATLVGTRPYLPYLLYLALAVAAIAWVTSLFFPSPVAWQWLSGAGIAAVAVPLVLAALWIHAKDVTLGGLFGGAFALVLATGMGIILVFPLMVALWALPTALFSAAVWSGFRTQVRPIWSLAWNSAGFADYWSIVRPTMLWILGAGTAIGLVALLIQFISRFTAPLWARLFEAAAVVDWPWLTPGGDSSLNLLLAATALATLAILLAHRIRGDAEAMKLHFGILAQFSGVALFLILTGPLFKRLGDWLSTLSLGGITAILAYGVVLLCALGIAWFLYFCIQSALDTLSQYIQYKLTQLAWQPISPPKLLRQIQRAGPFRRAQIVSLVSPARMKLGTDETIAWLMGIEHLCQTDPALSAYDAKLGELLAERRQDRTG